MRKLSIYALCALIVFAPACQGFSQQQRDAGRLAIEDAYDKGDLTAKQRDDAIAALEGGGDFSQWLYLGGSVLASVLLGVPISVGTVQKRAARAAKSA